MKKCVCEVFKVYHIKVGRLKREIAGAWPKSYTYILPITLNRWKARQEADFITTSCQ